MAVNSLLSPSAVGPKAPCLTCVDSRVGCVAATLVQIGVSVSIGSLCPPGRGGAVDADDVGQHGGGRVCRQRQTRGVAAGERVIRDEQACAERAGRKGLTGAETRIQQRPWGCQRAG